MEIKKSRNNNFVKIIIIYNNHNSNIFSIHVPLISFLFDKFKNFSVSQKEFVRF